MGGGASRCCGCSSADVDLDGPGEPTVEFIFRRLKKGWRRPKQRLSLSMPRWPKRVSGQHARLQLPNPVPALGQSEIPLLARSPRSGVHRTPRRNDPNVGVRPRSVRISLELRDDVLDDEVEPRLLPNSRPVRPHVASCQRISSCEKVLLILLQLYAANVRSPALFAISNARRTSHDPCELPRPWHDEIPNPCRAAPIRCSPRFSVSSYPEPAEPEPPV